MATVIEVVGRSAGKGQNPTGGHKYQVSGTDDRNVAYAMVHAASPAVVGGLVKQNVTVTELGGGVWDGAVSYGVMEQGEPGDISWSFEIGTQTFRRKCAENHIATYPAGADNHAGAIDVTGKGVDKKVEGADIFIPVFTWDETHYANYATVASYAFLSTMESIVAKTNHAAWRIWNKGELILLGVSGAKRGEEPVGVTFSFASSKTRVNYTVGGGGGATGISGVTKEGWHYLWVEFKDSEGVGLSHEIKAVHVEQVYEYANFNYLGLGDPWA